MAALVKHFLVANKAKILCTLHFTEVQYSNQLAAEYGVMFVYDYMCIPMLFGNTATVSNICVYYVSILHY